MEKQKKNGLVSMQMAWDVWAKGNRVSEYSQHVQDELKAAFFAAADSLMTISAAISFCVDESLRGQRHRDLMREIVSETDKRP